jgi:hypothetical protein
MTSETRPPVPDPTSDQVIAALLALLLLIGLIGNTTALFHFGSNLHRSLPNKLYTAIVCVDLLTCISIIPTIPSLLQARSLSLFSNSSVCWSATVVSRFSSRFSMFLVAVLSVTRGIAIVTPQRIREVRTTTVFLFLSSYAAFLIIIDGVLLGRGWGRPVYRDYLATCMLVFNKTIPENFQLFSLISDNLELFLTSAIVFISFTFGLAAMRRRGKASLISNTDKNKISRDVSLTISLFTGLFLVCNLPYLVYYSLQLTMGYIPVVREKLAPVIWVDMKWYGGLLLVVLPAFLNAVLNPCLYFLRLPPYRRRLCEWMKAVRRLVRKKPDMRIRRYGADVEEEGGL